MRQPCPVLELVALPPSLPASAEEAVVAAAVVVVVAVAAAAVAVDSKVDSWPRPHH